MEAFFLFTNEGISFPEHTQSRCTLLCTARPSAVQCFRMKMVQYAKEVDRVMIRTSIADGGSVVNRGVR